jgi:hypothetical protein
MLVMVEVEVVITSYWPTEAGAALVVTQVLAVTETTHPGMQAQAGPVGVAAAPEAAAV